jgi:signal transduction histidine kinase
VADSDPEVALVLWLLKTLVILPAIVYALIMLVKLEKGGKAIAEGNTSYRINTKGMFFDFKRHGNNLNSISEGMGKAVEKQLKSERMKTELITNVSHDIKTPITSIINYAGLIFDEPCDCENHKEYSVVLMKKADSLKRLLNDLVEVSRATTGNMDVELSECDASVLLTQLEGEFGDKCACENLELITSYPERSLVFNADSRRIWRVFENLLSNACKYSLPGSRVYMSAEEHGDNVSFVIRNTSKAPLNISADELTARFVRGDSSRSTEGSGLGLSIAKSLTELQGGTLDITIDGDLFKVTISFPKL